MTGTRKKENKNPSCIIIQVCQKRQARKSTHLIVKSTHEHMIEENRRRERHIDPQPQPSAPV
jgi:hypothetical protein